MNLGLKIKSIRCAKKIPAKEVYDGLLSRSMYYKFENQNYNISYQLLFSIMQRLNIDFNDLCYGDIWDDTYYFQMMYSLLVSSEDEYLRYLNELKRLYDKKQASSFLYIYILGNQLYRAYYLKENLDDQVMVIKDYLFGKEEWEIFDIHLIMYGIFIFSLDEIDSFWRRAVKRIFKWNQRDGRSIILLLSSIIHLCYIRKDKSRLCFFINVIQKVDVSCDSICYLLLMRFYRQLNHCLMTKDNQCQAAILNDLQLFKELDLGMLYEHCDEIYRYVIENDV